MNIKDEVKALVDRIKLKLNAEVNFKEAKLKDGTIVQYEGELNVGTALNVIDAGGGVSPAPNGSHELEDGTIVTVAEGFITEIMKPEPTVEVEVETANVEPVKMEDVKAVIAEAIANYSNQEVKALQAQIKEQKEVIKDMFAAIEALSNEAPEPEKPAKTSFAKTVKQGQLSAFERMQAAAAKFKQQN